MILNLQHCGNSVSILFGISYALIFTFSFCQIQQKIVLARANSFFVFLKHLD